MKRVFRAIAFDPSYWNREYAAMSNAQRHETRKLFFMRLVWRTLPLRFLVLFSVMLLCEPLYAHNLFFVFLAILVGTIMADQIIFLTFGNRRLREAIVSIGKG